MTLAAGDPVAFVMSTWIVDCDPSRLTVSGVAVTVTDWASSDGPDNDAVLD